MLLKVKSSEIAFEAGFASVRQQVKASDSAIYRACCICMQLISTVARRKARYENVTTDLPPS